MNKVVEALNVIPDYYHPCHGPSYYFPNSYRPLISRCGSFVLPPLMGGTVTALLWQSTLTHRLQWRKPLCQGLENQYSGQSQDTTTTFTFYC